MNLFNQALKMDPEFMDPLRGKAMAFYQMGQPDSALFYFDRIIELSPDNHGGYLGKGMVYMFTNRPDSAYQYIAKGYELAQNDPSANLLFAQYYHLARNDYLKALPFFHRAYELGGEAAEICGNIGHIYWTLGLYSLAEKYYNQAMGLSQECLFISQYSLILEFQKKYEEGMHFLDSICAIRTCRDFCEINKFRIAVDKKAFDQAEEYYSNIQSIDGRLNDYEKIYLGYFYKNQNKEMEADRLLRSIRNSLEKLLPVRRTYALIWLSAIHAILDEKEKSFKYLSEVIDKELFLSLMDFAQSSPFYENLREDHDFKALVKRAEDEKGAAIDQVLEMVQRGEINL
jgi:Tfp pilus assembly protein PilF